MQLRQAAKRLAGQRMRLLGTWIFCAIQSVNVVAATRSAPSMLNRCVLAWLQVRVIASNYPKHVRIPLSEERYVQEHTVEIQQRLVRPSRTDGVRNRICS
ncbi:hypothetical protein C8R45DRAFT_1011560 [Mycena sanguinolenta]|nr:hypothetical protein C8R45DRAFT_1011560 [Mycena sanguinolenta]